MVPHVKGILCLSSLTNRKVQSKLQRWRLPSDRYLFVCLFVSDDLQDISKRVRFKTEGHNHLQLIAVCLSFWWLGKLHILFGHQKTPQLLKNDFNAIRVLPFCQNWYATCIHLQRHKREEEDSGNESCDSGYTALTI